MSHFRRSLSILSVSLLALCSSAYAQDTTTSTVVVEKKVIVTPAPTATCTKVEGHWEADKWISAHNVCKYDNRAEGVAWVEPYWSCSVYTTDGNCTTWELVPGQWVKTLP